MNSRRRSARFSPLALTELESRDTPASSFLAAGAAAGGTPLVEVFRPDGTTLARFQAFESSFRGGVRAVAAELDGNPDTVEVIAAPGPGGAPRVTVWSVNATTGAVAPLASFFAFDPSFTGGVRVAAGRVTGPSDRDEIIVGADTGGGPRVRVFDLNGTAVVPAGGALGDLFAFEPGFLGGVRVAAGDLDGNPGNGDELVAAAGPGGGPRVRTFSLSGAIISDDFVFAPGFSGGVNVAVDSNGQLRVDPEAADFSQRDVFLNQAAASEALQAAGATGPGTVFTTLFSNPAFTTALTNMGLVPTAFFSNGAFNTTAFAANTPAFDTAFLSVFGTTASANLAFSSALNTVNTLAVLSPQLNTVGAPTPAAVIDPTATLSTGSSSFTGPFTVSTVTVPGGPFDTPLLSPTGPFATTTGTTSTAGVPIGATTIVM